MTVLRSLILLLVFAPASGAEEAAPIGVQRLDAFLEAHAAGDRAAFSRFADEHFRPPEPGGRSQEERLGTMMRIAMLTGGLVLHKVEEVSDEKVVALVQKQRDEGWARLTLELEAEPPHLVSGVGLMLAPPPDDLELEPLTEAEVVAELEAHVAKLAAADRFSGAVLFARGERVLFERAYGKAEMRFDVDNGVETKLNLGSANKMFTAVAVAQLVEGGKLSFDSRLIDVLPDYPDREIAEQVTLHHLLTHTSGMGTYWQALYAADWTEIRSHDQLLELFAGEPLDFEPGEKFQYSNSGFAVLGKVIEQASGMSYFDYVRKHVFEPAGMTSTDSYEADQVVPNLATGYTLRLPPSGGTPSSGGSHSHDHDGDANAPRRSNVFNHSAKGSAAGGGYSTVGDLHRFALALWSDVLLEPETRATLLEGKVEMAPGIHYAYGFGVHGAGERRNLGHNGGAPGISADFRSYPETGYTFAVLANYDGAAMLVSRKLETLLARLSDD